MKTAKKNENKWKSFMTYIRTLLAPQKREVVRSKWSRGERGSEVEEQRPTASRIWIISMLTLEREFTLFHWRLCSPSSSLLSSHPFFFFCYTEMTGATEEEKEGVGRRRGRRKTTGKAERGKKIKGGKWKGIGIKVRAGHKKEEAGEAGRKSRLEWRTRRSRTRATRGERWRERRQEVVYKRGKRYEVRCCRQWRRRDKEDGRRLSTE